MFSVELGIGNNSSSGCWVYDIRVAARINEGRAKAQLKQVPKLMRALVALGGMGRTKTSGQAVLTRRHCKIVREAQGQSIS